MTVALNPKVKYIGVDDLDLDLFESQYVVPEGMSYNSYVILDGKVAVMDTTDARKGEEWKANLAEALEGRKPDYLVVHHMEPDHSALIAWALEAYPGLVLVASAKAIQMLGQFFEGIDLEGRTMTVKEGEVPTPAVAHVRIGRGARAPHEIQLLVEVVLVEGVAEEERRPWLLVDFRIHVRRPSAA